MPQLLPPLPEHHHALVGMDAIRSYTVRPPTSLPLFQPNQTQLNLLLFCAENLPRDGPQQTASGWSGG